MQDVHADSRASARYPAVQTAVYLGWWEEPEFRTCLANLRNLSHGGAMVVVSRRPTDGNPLWLCLAGTPPSDWVEVAVVAAITRHGNQYELHVQFVDSCPYDLFNEAVFGIVKDRDPQ